MGDDSATATSAPPVVGAAPDETGYPPLQSVPPRPRLSYTVQQQRQIVEALIADRENARYTSQVVRHRSGLSSMPPPPEAPDPAPELDIEPGTAPQVPAPRREEQETLVDFLNALLFDDEADPPVAEPAPDRASETEDPEAAAQALSAGPPIEQATRPAPLPPGRGAVAARLAAGPDLIDRLVDTTVAQMPLPPERSALAARLAAAEQTDTATAPLPAPRPAMARSADAALPASVPAPPPVKPIVPVGAPVPPTPTQKPADYRSAAAPGPRGPETAATAPPAPIIGTVAAAAG